MYNPKDSLFLNIKIIQPVQLEYGNMAMYFTKK